MLCMSIIWIMFYVTMPIRQQKTRIFISQQPDMVTCHHLCHAPTIEFNHILWQLQSPRRSYMVHMWFAIFQMPKMKSKPIQLRHNYILLIKIYIYHVSWITWFCYNGITMCDFLPLWCSYLGCFFFPLHHHFLHVWFFCSN